MYTQTVLEDKKRRDIYTRQEEILDKFKPVMTIPGTDLITFKQVAEYFNVEYKTVTRCFHRHMIEFTDDDADWYTPATFRNMMTQDRSIKSVTNLVGRAVVEFDNGFAITVPNRGTHLMHKRVLVRFAFLLKDSIAASKLRSLFAESNIHSKNEQTHNNGGDRNELTELLIRMVTSDDIVTRLKAVGNVLDIYNRIKDLKGNDSYELGELY